ncbi:probable WRKY transcription factor 65 isoform X2 [Rosa rugosa]|uniref:probable WRKY transcription factor 65 isoform X2 n=1 Tax=Rosa rugosa TaxID=74645 RepID=UPI002B40853A|nr:probable WRKY transcription factor 65 isoform X2 [Rosa rugosa]
MDSPTFFNKHFMSDIDHDDYNNNNTTTSSTPENSSGSPPPPPPAFNDVVYSKIASSPKKSRRAVQKRVVSIPIKENSNTNTPPPSDSWAWRKYGQKPIKGSPYPRGYYRCSSSKGCPARKQVERSRVDPTTLVITYSSEHNHPWPASRSHHGTKPGIKTETREEEAAAGQPEPDPEERRFAADLGGDEESTLVIIPSAVDEFGWFADMETTSSRVLESPIFAESGGGGGGVDTDDVAGMVFPMGEEDESLFADLGELPECSLVFRHRRVGGGGVGPQAQIC